MAAYVYIIHREKLDRFYTGVTTLEASERLENHINKIYGKGNFTQKADDWKLFHSILCEDFSQARKIELHIKRMKSSIYIRNLLKYPEISTKLRRKYETS
jgi:putative endonuclease